MAAVKKPVPKKVVKKPATKARASTSYTGPREPDITVDVRGAVVDEIPAVRGSSQRKWRYARVMREIREQVGPGKPVILAKFVGPSGATTVRRELMTGKRPVDGQVGEWQLDARRLDSGGSILYATLVNSQ